MAIDIPFGSQFTNRPRYDFISPLPLQHPGTFRVQQLKIENTILKIASVIPAVLLDLVINTLRLAVNVAVIAPANLTLKLGNIIHQRIYGPVVTFSEPPESEDSLDNSLSWVLSALGISSLIGGGILAFKMHQSSEMPTFSQQEFSDPTHLKNTTPSDEMVTECLESNTCSKEISDQLISRLTSENISIDARNEMIVNTNLLGKIIKSQSTAIEDYSKKENESDEIFGMGAKVIGGFVAMVATGAILYNFKTTPVAPLNSTDIDVNRNYEGLPPELFIIAFRSGDPSGGKKGRRIILGHDVGSGLISSFIHWAHGAILGQKLHKSFKHWVVGPDFDIAIKVYREYAISRLRKIEVEKAVECLKKIEEEAAKTISKEVSDNLSQAFLATLTN